jgi:DNA-binding CsgD family transcriptional regulator
MRKQKLLQRLVAALATNEGVQPKRTEIWQRLKSLTPREVDVLCHVLGGQINREIAAELGVTERTIKVHRGRVMEKLGVQSTAQLFPMVLRVLREGGCKILEDIKELGRETAASNRPEVRVLSPKTGRGYRRLGVSRQRVTDRLSSRYAPTLGQGLRPQAFLKKRRKSRG